jgi:hypothetical protein
MAPRVAEATAPCRVDLAGGVPGVATVTVAIDRRAWCRVETGADGVLIESRDTLRKAGGRDVTELIAQGALAPVARVLRAMGLETGVRVVTQSRVPEGSGLGESAALAAAVAGAAARVLGSDADPEEIARLASEAEPPGDGVAAGIREAHTAVRGGTLALHPEAAACASSRSPSTPPASRSVCCSSRGCGRRSRAGVTRPSSVTWPLAHAGRSSPAASRRWPASGSRSGTLAGGPAGRRRRTTGSPGSGATPGAGEARGRRRPPPRRVGSARGAGPGAA